MNFGLGSFSYLKGLFSKPKVLVGAWQPDNLGRRWDYESYGVGLVRRRADSLVMIRVSNRIWLGPDAEWYISYRDQKNDMKEFSCLFKSRQEAINYVDSNLSALGFCHSDLI